MSDSVNQVCLSARLVECEPLRYTPAGVALCQGSLEHESVQPEAGFERQVRFTIAARFAGNLAQRIATESLGCQLQVRGFIAASKVFKDGGASRTLTMHVLSYQTTPVNQDN